MFLYIHPSIPYDIEKGEVGDEGRDQGLILVFNKLITSAKCYCIQKTTLVRTSLAPNTVIGDGLSSQLPPHVQSSLHGQARQSSPLTTAFWTGKVARRLWDTQIDALSPHLFWVTDFIYFNFEKCRSRLWRLEERIRILDIWEAANIQTHVQEILASNLGWATVYYEGSWFCSVCLGGWGNSPFKQTEAIFFHNLNDSPFLITFT